MREKAHNYVYEYVLHPQKAQTQSKFRTFGGDAMFVS